MFSSKPWILFFSTLASEDLAFIYGLFNVQDQSLHPFNFIIFYLLGVFIGDIILYGLGKSARKLSKTKYFCFIHKYIYKTQRKKKFDVTKFTGFDQFLAFTRFIPGSRIPTYIYCGISNYPFFKFCAVLLASSLFYSSVGLLILKMFYLGIDNETFWKTKLLIAFLSAFLTILFLNISIKILKLKLTYSEIIRPLKVYLLRYCKLEFWPSFILYAPFAPYFIYLFLKYGGTKTILSTNPSIKMSGLIGELKSDIDIFLSKYIKNQRIKTFKLDEKTLPFAKKIMSENKLSFPVIIKPDSGMRGAGVKIIKTENELEEILNKTEEKQVLQEFCDFKNEWGIYYYRFPNAQSGKIFSVTVKEKPLITGDGKLSLYKLVLSDQRLCQRFDIIFKECNLSPHYIPKVNEKVQLVNKGNHSKGCIFLDGSEWVKNSQLKNVQWVLDQLEGFYVGRIDIKFRDLESLSCGEFKIIEINGAGAESSNFYDPKFSVKEAYKIIKEQWTIIFQVGHMNRKLGKETKKSIWNLFSEIIQYRRMKT